MRGAHLWGAHLGGADLTGTDLREGDVCGADLCRSNLSNADLRESDLSETDLREADLRGANLSGVDLVKADLSRARLTETNMHAAVLGCSIIADCDLSSVKGIEAIEHVAPSDIGIDTILKSKGRIPEMFLKGIGVPDVLIASAKSLAQSPIEFQTCLIRHSRKDKEFAKRLCADFRAKGLRCWNFPELTPHGRFQGDFGHDIFEYDKVIAVCSEYSLHGEPLGEVIIDDVCDEIERALQREGQEKKEILFPIRIDDYLFDKWDHPRKADVIAKVVGDFRNWKDHEQYKKNFDKLLKALNRPQPDRP